MTRFSLARVFFNDSSPKMWVRTWGLLRWSFRDVTNLVIHTCTRHFLKGNGGWDGWGRDFHMGWNGFRASWNHPTPRQKKNKWFLFTRKRVNQCFLHIPFSKCSQSDLYLLSPQWCTVFWNRSSDHSFESAHLRRAAFHRASKTWTAWREQMEHHWWCSSSVPWICWCLDDERNKDWLLTCFAWDDTWQMIYLKYSMKMIIFDYCTCKT